jgi:hypothetical protein
MSRVRDIGAWVWAYAWTALWMLAMIGLGLLAMIAPRELADRGIWRAYVWFCRRTRA